MNAGILAEAATGIVLFTAVTWSMFRREHVERPA
jgi:hypothetical protein